MDDHTLIQIDKNMILFGGFIGGWRVNSVLSTTFTAPNQIAWSMLRAAEGPSKVFP